MGTLRPVTDLGGFRGRSIDGFVIDFAGACVRRGFDAFAPQAAGKLNISQLSIDEEVFEWLDLIESIETSRRAPTGTYVFAELGAGYGRWSARAHHLARRAGHARPTLILVEAEPQHLAWLDLNLEDNQIDPKCAIIHRAALASHVGETLFYVAMPKGTSQNSPAEWYGQSIVKAYERPVLLGGRTVVHALARGLRRVLGGTDYAGRERVLLESGWQAVPVATKRLRDVVPDGVIVDLADFDVQGAELESISESIDLCDAAIRMMHIGTHDVEIESGLRDLLGEHGWECVRAHSLGGTRETEFGPVDFVDGVQTWINPRLRPVRYSLETVIE